MNIVALVANVIQLLIILAVFFIRGLELGPLVIFLLFLLMPVPFINFLALFFSNRPGTVSSTDDAADNGIIKREAVRVLYGEDRCPVLTVGSTAYAVRDLSEGGVRILAGTQMPFRKKVTGDIRLLSGETIPFKARVVRQEEGEVAFKFTAPIGTAILMEEKKALAVA
jgi:hypothetical protein